MLAHLGKNTVPPRCFGRWIGRHTGDADFSSQNKALVFPNRISCYLTCGTESVFVVHVEISSALKPDCCTTPIYTSTSEHFNLLMEVISLVYHSILEAIGHTPMIKLSRIVPKGSADILVKYEGVNIGGSIKTRTAYNMIHEAEKRGIITPDTIIVEPTSGNQGIGLSLIGAVKGYKVRIIMPDSVSNLTYPSNLKGEVFADPCSYTFCLILGQGIR